jgi:ketosteroid isomerase-like protein
VGPQADVDALLAAEAARVQAILDGDVDGLAARLADRFQLVHSGGRLDVRARVLADRARGELVYRRYRNDDVRAEVHGDVGFLTGRVEIVPELDGAAAAPFSGRFVSVWERAGTTWRAVLWQVTGIR